MTCCNFIYRKSNAVYLHLYIYVKNNQKETALKGPENLRLTTTLHCFLSLLKFITCLLHI